MKKILILVFFVALLFLLQPRKKAASLSLGDLHYDLLQDHDMDWLSTKPGDLRQVTEEYTVYTEENWNDFMSLLKTRAASENPPVKAIIQLGDLSEGLAGTEEKARQMASNTMKAIDAVQMPAPWIIAKGNHDITGPGRKRSFSGILCSDDPEANR